MKICSIDLETTGLNPDIHDIVEFSLVIDDYAKWQPCDSLPFFQCYVEKEGSYVGDPMALSMHSKIFHKLATKSGNIVSLRNLMYKLRNFLTAHGFEPDKNDQIEIFVAGKNFAMFDLPFLQKHISDWAGIKINRRIIDVGSMYLDPFKETVPNLQQCLTAAKLHEEVSHSAYEDALQVLKLIRNKHNVPLTFVV